MREIINQLWNAPADRVYDDFDNVILSGAIFFLIVLIVWGIACWVDRRRK